MVTIHPLKPTRTFPLRYIVNNRFIVCFCKHAIRRCQTRGLAPFEVIESLAGVPMLLWKKLGVAAKKSGNTIIIMTCWPSSASAVLPLW